MKTIKYLFTASAVLGMALLAIGLFGLGIWMLMYALDASAYNEAELVKAGQMVALPTLAPQQEVIPTESFQLLPDENAPVAFAVNGESFTLLGPVPTVESLVVAGVQPVIEPTETPLPLPAVTRFSIPVIGMDWSVESVGMVQDESGLWYYDTPLATVGWHEGSGRPGGGQTIEFNGHIRWYGTDGVFRYLSTVALDNEIVLTTEDGAEHRYIVRQVLTRDPIEAAQYMADLEARGEELVIAVTCINWSAEKQIYLDRLIVVAVKSD